MRGGNPLPPFNVGLLLPGLSPRVPDIGIQNIHSGDFVIRAGMRINCNGLPLDQRFHAFLELPLLHVAHIHQVGMAGFTAVFVDEDLHDLAFSGQLILFTHDLQEGDGVGEVEIAEVEALGGESIPGKHISCYPLYMGGST